MPQHCCQSSEAGNFTVFLHGSSMIKGPIITSRTFLQGGRQYPTVIGSRPIAPPTAYTGGSLNPFVTSPPPPPVAFAPPPPPAASPPPPASSRGVYSGAYSGYGAYGSYGRRSPPPPALTGKLLFLLSYSSMHT